MPLRVKSSFSAAAIFPRRSLPTPLFSIAALLQHRSTSTLLTLATLTPSTFLFLSEDTSSLILIVIPQKFNFFFVLHHLTYCCRFLTLQFSIIFLCSIHSPITLISSFVAQLIFDSTFNLYRRFNINSYSIFKYLCILRLFSILFKMYFNSTLYSRNVLTLQVFGIHIYFRFCISKQHNLLIITKHYSILSTYSS